MRERRWKQSFEDVSYLTERVLSLSRLNDYSERFEEKYIRDITVHDIYPEKIRHVRVHSTCITVFFKNLWNKFKIKI